MNYMGGKHRQGPKIAEVVRQVLQPGQWYVEPFCGAMGTAYRVDHELMILNDVSRALMRMWSDLLDPELSIVLPDVITEDEYSRVKAVRDPDDWRTAYYGFGMSFGSMYFGTYARNGRGTDFAVNLLRSARIKRSTQLKRSTLSKRILRLSCGSYDQMKIPAGSVVYVDPPYAGRRRAHDCGPFDHAAFWQWCRDRVAEGHILLATEFVVPADFRVIHNFGDTVVRHHAGRPSDGTAEVLVCHESQFHLFEGNK